MLNLLERLNAIALILLAIVPLAIVASPHSKFGWPIRFGVMLPIAVGLVAWTVDTLLGHPDHSPILIALTVTPFVIAGVLLLLRNDRIYWLLNAMNPLGASHEGAQNWRLIASSLCVVALVAACTMLAWPVHINAPISAFGMVMLGAGLLKALNFKDWTVDTIVPGAALIGYAAFQVVAYDMDRERALLFALMFKVVLLSSVYFFVVSLRTMHRKFSDDLPLIFIGHGHSKFNDKVRKRIDGLIDTKHIECRNYASSDIIGKHTLDHVLELADRTVFACLVLVEDKGDMPRLNVVHELGLFQGRLGKRRAVAIIDEKSAGRDELSNIHGLTVIPYDRAKPKAALNTLQEILTRERLTKEFSSGHGRV